MRFAQQVYLHPAGSLCITFIAKILLGTLLLAMPFSSSSGVAVSFVDALFTATSAVCVTGLTVLDTGKDFSLFGKGVILSLIQLGGLGIMTLTTATAVFVKRSVTLSQRKVLQEIFDQGYYNEVMDLLRGIVKGTFAIELIGAIILSAAWWDIAPDHSTAIGWGVFHSVSAFCNAGFSVFSDSIISFAHDPVIILTFAFLIIIGGLGFMVIGPIMAFRRPSGLHFKLVIRTTLLLLLSGTVFYLLFDYHRVTPDVSLAQRIMDSFFRAVTCRTAGFDIVPYSNISMASVLITIVFMFIGGSPASTAGGIKTTTFATLVLTVKSWIKRRQDVEACGRRIMPDTILKAITVALISATLIFIFTIFLSMTENEAPLHVLLYEVTSAFGTVGLSLGITPKLTILGKLLITILMYIGRIGPVTIALIVSGPKATGKWHYPTGQVIIG